MSTPETIHRLVERFEENRESYRSGKYNEAQLRQEFLNPFFEALGWDVFNKKDYGEAYKEVIHEASQEVEGTAKAPDYAFRIGGRCKFFVEAKKPSVNIQYDIHPAFQLRRYAWSAKLPLSILTDFEEFAVYESRSRPDMSDSAATGRVMLLNYRDYLNRWDELAAIFSPEAIMRGSFDKYAESQKGKKGTLEVDDAFLEEIEHWRELLARNLALRNPDLQNARELNYAVQMTIDRIVFLRICEDRGIEREGQLQDLLEGEQVYARLCQVFKQADNRYNSGLFHFIKEKGQSSQPDDLTLRLKIDDKVLVEIIKQLYYPAPYVFREIPADILGQVYERFLGKVIRLTAGHQAKVEEKPEVRKAGGVYYTPTYIVDYIVKNTVGKLLENKTPKEAAFLKIVDPACGSGSFLLGAFQYLLDWHTGWYGGHEPEKWAAGKAPVLYRAQGGGWRLTTSEKKRILLSNIHGVDIDPQAVEVTKLSLSLKVLEGESEQTIGAQLGLFKERALPDLGRNIQCGNSLIGPDYYDGRMLVDKEEELRVNAFNWKAAFPQVFIAGGFDVVIGNPPWGAEFNVVDEIYIRSKYEVAKTAALDSYAVFIEGGFNKLKNGGLLGFITPDTFLRKSELLPIRSFLLNKTVIVELIETGPVFSQVRDTWCLVFTLSKPISTDTKIRHRQLSRFITAAEDRLELFGRGNWSFESEVSQTVWQYRPDLIIGYLATEEGQKLIEKIEFWPSLGQQNDKYKISRGEEGSKYAIIPDKTGHYFMVIPQNVERYFVESGVRVNDNVLTQTKVVSLYNHPKIWIIRIQKMRWKQRIVCAFDERQNSAAMKTLQVIVSPIDDKNSLKYISGILASKLINFWCINYLADDMNQSYLSRIPIRTIDFTVPADKTRHDRMVSLVERMLELHKRSPRTPQEKEMLQREIESTDAEIDRLVYELYGLTEEEITIVEGR